MNCHYERPVLARGICFSLIMQKQIPSCARDGKAETERRARSAGQSIWRGKDAIMKANAMERPLAEVDPDIAQAIENEERRQHEGLELIASENFVSEAVLEAAGSVFTNKYAEGYPGKRYYGGCEFTDVVENLARERVKKLFGAEHANVQPHSGSTANMAAYAALIQPGDTILGLNLAHGGH